ncbi:MAG: hypothetical protein JWQ34_3155 [Mucilaginibacter sp.]|uniref:hypothetical protein n=1 Tax=Mucilaginibacter sp. TaxID=1882438 RepID=UPI00261FECD6|nr:hypothetical protein [Mucilaginibacter sp.]MDB5004930.1 hypothetical protein [Mucilaginibacter sp.]
MKQTPSKPVQSPFNKEVQTVFFKILKEAKALLATLEREELRYSLIREDRLSDSLSRIIHEFCNPLLYLRLESDIDGKLSIRYGFEPCEDYAHITVAFTRFLYKATMREATSQNIEDSIKTSFFIHNPDEMYAYLEEQMKHHTFHLIKYKPAAVRRKQMKAA